jgi:dTDP-4-dehydrorhamnose 3,5-epimerase
MPIIDPALITGVVLVTPDLHGDERGRFSETYRRSWFPHGQEMVQGNRSDKSAGAIVGLHYHRHQADYWYVVRGAARVVLHDLRVGSPTQDTTLVVDIGDGNEQGVYIPPGVGHGFSARTDLTITYLVDRYYDPDDELGVAWDDPDLAIDWGVPLPPVLSARDRQNPRKADIPEGLRPVWAGREVG